MNQKRYGRSIIALALLLGGTSQAWADECALTVNSSDQMQFDQQTIVVPSSCEKVTLTLNHSGKLPKTVMGHNWVLSNTADVQAVATDGMRAGADNHYVKPDDVRVIAATEIIGGGESTQIEFDVAQLNANGDYTFFCSFPGHWAIMKGKLVVDS